MKRSLMFLLMIVVMLGCGCANNLGSVKHGDPIILECLCDNCTYMNLTSVTYANNSHYSFWGQAAMTKNGGVWNYSFTKTEGLGENHYKCCGDDDGEYDCTSGNFLVTPSGSNQSTSQGINSAAFLMLMLGITVLIGYLGFKFIENDYLWILGLLMIFFMFMFVTYDVYLGYEYHLTLTGINDGSMMPQVMFYMLMFILVSSLLVSGILLFTRWKQLMKWYKRMKEENKREAQEKDMEWI